ncbi:MAG: site-specific integrase [Alicyclobacillaceae bacterium]|nr:site-specific integrase [Alicyclobacillaceae bacterium]
MPRRGQVRKRANGSYIARLYIGKDSEGHRHWTSQTFAKQKEAEAWLSEVLTEKAHGTFQAHSKETVEVFLRRWLTESASNRVQRRTLEDYTALVERHIIPHIGNIKLTELRADRIQKFYNKIASAHGLSSAKHVHSVLHAALNQAVKWGIITRNVSSHVDVPRPEKREVRPLSPEEVSRFIEIAVNDYYFVYFVFLLDTGLRPGEALALTWDDVDFKTSYIKVTKALAGKKEKYIGPPKTRSSRRQMPVSEATIEMLKNHHEQITNLKISKKHGWFDNNLVFPNSVGGFSSQPNIMRRHFKPILKKVGLPEFMRIYDLRHSCATLLLAANVHPKIVAERLGHSTYNLTMDTYSHVIPGMQQEVAKIMNFFLGAPKATENN